MFWVLIAVFSVGVFFGWLVFSPVIRECELSSNGLDDVETMIRDVLSEMLPWSDEEQEKIMAMYRECVRRELESWDMERRGKTVGLPTEPQIMPPGSVPDDPVAKKINQLFDCIGWEQFHRSSYRTIADYLSSLHGRVSKLEAFLSDDVSPVKFSEFPEPARPSTAPWETVADPKSADCRVSPVLSSEDDRLPTPKSTQMGELLREWRKEAGLSFGQIDKLAFIDREIMQRIEDGLTLPRPHELRSLIGLYKKEKPTFTSYGQERIQELYDSLKSESGIRKTVDPLGTPGFYDPSSGAFVETSAKTETPRHLSKSFDRGSVYTPAPVPPPPIDRV